MGRPFFIVKNDKIKNHEIAFPIGYTTYLSH